MMLKKSLSQKQNNRQLQINFCEGREKYVAIVENFPGLDAAMTFDDLMYMSHQLRKAAETIGELNHKKAD